MFPIDRTRLSAFDDHEEWFVQRCGALRNEGATLLRVRSRACLSPRMREAFHLPRVANFFRTISRGERLFLLTISWCYARLIAKRVAKTSAMRRITA
jgi:hypothetical protein